MNKRLHGKIALVSGAGSTAGEGIGNGRAIALLFAREGASILAVDRDAAAAAETGRLIREEGGHCEIFQADVGEAVQIEAMVGACASAFGGIDILVNNVGIGEMGGAVELSEAAWDKSFDVNVKSIFLSCKYAIPVMEKRGGGSIVNISSVASIRWNGVPYVAYGASKAAVNGLTQHVAMQYARKNIRANAVLPGLMKTPMITQPLSKFYGNVDAMIAERNRMCPMGHMGDAWDVAHAALFLASEEAKYITGTQIVVDGGLSQQVIAPA